MRNLHFQRPSRIPALENPQHLAELMKQDFVILFKHSLTCSLSAAAYTEVLRFHQERPEVPLYLVAVQTQPELIEQVSEGLGITHASPQILVCRSGSAISTASHFRITLSRLHSMVEEATLPAR